MKTCLHCGTEIPDEERFCCECGAEYVCGEDGQSPVMAAEPAAVVNEEISLEEVLGADEAEEKAAESPAEEPVTKKKTKWWYVAIPAVLVVITVVLLLGPFFIYLSPKTVLAKSFAETAKDLSERSEGTPLAVMNKAFDESQKNTVTVDFNISQPMIGDMYVGMVAKIDSSINQGHIGIQADVLGEEVNMNLYMDREVAAIHMDRVTGNKYYGIYYGTFGQDIRNNEFMYDTIGEENIVAIEEIVDTINQMMNLEGVTPEQQAESLKKYGEVILTFAEDEDVAVGKSRVSVDGKTEACKTISFAVTNEEYAELMMQLINVAQTDPMMLYYYKSNTLDFEGDGWQPYLDDLREKVADLGDNGEECRFTFYLYGGKVVQMDAQYAQAETEWLWSVNYGSDASETDITVYGEFTEGESQTALEITLSTHKEGEIVAETLRISDQTGDEVPVESEFGYEWNRLTGDMHLYAREGDADTFEMDCVFTELENGYSLHFSGFEDLMESLTGDMLGIEMSLDFSMTAGAEIEVPEIEDIAKMTEMGLLQITMKLMEILEV